MFKRNLLKIYVLLWFITGCKISYKTYNFENSPEIEKPNYSNNNSWAVLPDNFPDEIWINRLNDPIQREIYNEILYKYDDILFLISKKFLCFTAIITQS